MELTEVGISKELNDIIVDKGYKVVRIDTNVSEGESYLKQDVRGSYEIYKATDDFSYAELLPIVEPLAPKKVTLTDIEANIASEHYFTAADGVAGYHPATPYLIEAASGEVLAKWDKHRAHVDANVHQSLRLLTFCVLVLRNGFTVTGESACVSPENFDAELGRKIARQKAVEKIWPLMGYELCSTLKSINQLQQTGENNLPSRTKGLNMHWQPIETCPKENGKRYLITKDCGPNTLPSVSIVFGIDGQSGWIYSDASVKTIEDHGYRATHWMPLPALPGEA